MVPDVIPKLTKNGFEIVVEDGLGNSAGFSNEEYREDGYRVVLDDDSSGVVCDIIKFVQSNIDPDLEFIEDRFPNIFQLAMKYILLFVIKNNLIYMFIFL